jgi:hypothetical protein
MAWNTLPLEIRGRLLMVDDITDRVGERIHYQELPQSSKYPHIWFERSGTETDELLDTLGPAVERFTLEIIGDEFDSELIDAVIGTLQNLDGPVGTGTVFVTHIDDADDDYLFKSSESDKLFMHALRVSVYHDNEF